MQRHLINSSALLILLYYGYLCFSCYRTYLNNIEDISNQISQLDSKITARKKELEVVHSLAADADRIRNKNTQIEDSLKKVEEQLPSRIVDVENLDVINRLAEEQNLQKISMKPLAENQREYFYVKQYQFDAIGTFFQILIFLEKLRNNVRILNVSKLKMHSDENDQRGRFQIINVNIIIESYRYAGIN